MNFLHILKDIFFEKREQKTLRYIPSNLTEHYKKELSDCALDEVLVATKYVNVEDVLSRFKYNSDRHVVEELVELLSKIVEVGEVSVENDPVIVPVPMHWSRYFHRGFNHMYLLVDLLSKKTHIPCRKILKAHWTRHQSHLSRAKRLENKKNSFTISPHTSLPPVVVLVDDVISTGSTANECAKVLKKHGVKRIIGVFLASNA